MKKFKNKINYTEKKDAYNKKGLAYQERMDA